MFFKHSTNGPNLDGEELRWRQTEDELRIHRYFTHHQFKTHKKVSLDLEKKSC